MTRLTLFTRTACVLACSSVFMVMNAAADSIIFGTSEISGVDFQFVRGGKIFYLDSAGRIQQAPAADVDRLRFDDIPTLDDAERELARGDLDGALDELLTSMAKAKTDVQRLWIHTRLAHVHNRLGDFIEAASSAAAVIATDPNPAWLGLAPECRVNEATWYSVAEARDHLHRARRALGNNAAVERVVTELLAVIEPLYAQQREKNPRKEYRNGMSVSGILLRDLEAGWPGRNRENRLQEGDDGDGQATDQTGINPVAGGENTTDPDGPATIQQLLDQREFASALDLLQSLERDPGGRDLARYLYQYGMALVGTGQRRDAALRFMQCTAHFGGTRWQTLSVLEMAVIYRDLWRKPETARRLARQALEEAKHMGDPEIAMRAAAVMESIGEGD